MQWLLAISCYIHGDYDRRLVMTAMDVMDVMDHGRPTTQGDPYEKG
jgi:hypothetical protein